MCDRAMRHAAFPGKCGYKSETGGRLKERDATCRDFRGHLVVAVQKKYGMVYVHILDDIGCIYMIIYYDIPYSYITYVYIYIYTNTVNLFTKRTPCIGCLLKWSHRAFRTALQELRELTNAKVRDYHKAYYRLRRDPKPLEATCSEDLMNMHERGSCTTKCIIRIYIYICTYVHM